MMRVGVTGGVELDDACDKAADERDTSELATADTDPDVALATCSLDASSASDIAARLVWRICCLCRAVSNAS